MRENGAVTDTDREREAERIAFLVASVLDYPSCFMSGPSQGSRAKARRVIECLECEGYAIVRSPPPDVPSWQEVRRLRAQNERLLERLRRAGLLGEPVEALDGNEQLRGG